MRAARLHPLLLPLAMLPLVGCTSNAAFQLTNNTPAMISQVYAVPPGQRPWGQDRLGGHVIAPGAWQVIVLPRNSCYNDLRVVYSNGAAEERRNLEVCTIREVVVGGNAPVTPNRVQFQNLSFSMQNRTPRPMREVYVSPNGAENWGPDRLMGATLSPNQTTSLRLPGGECRQDVRAVFADGREEVRRGADVCGGQTFAFAPEAARPSRTAAAAARAAAPATPPPPGAAEGGTPPDRPPEPAPAAAASGSGGDAGRAAGCALRLLSNC